jgi:hypothetical protein
MESTGFSQCPVCESIVKNKGKYAHFKTVHPELNFQDFKDKFTPALKPEEEEEAKREGEEGPPEAEERRLVAQFGREGLNKIKRERLRKVLDLVPGVGNKVIPFILHKWDVNTRLRDDPNELFNMLNFEAGLKPNVATSIVKDVFSVEEEFADLLQRRGEQPIFMGPHAPQMGQQFFGGYGGYGGYGYGTWTPSPPFSTAGSPVQYGAGPVQYGTGGAPFLTREEFYRMQREADEKDRLSKMESEMRSLREEIPKMIRESLPRTEEETDYVVEEIPVDRSGNPCPPDKAVSILTRRVPFRDRGLTAEDVRRIVQESQARLTAEDVRRIIREERGEKSPEESPMLRELKAKLESVTDKYEDLKERMESDERKRMLDTINQLRDEISRVQMTGGDWKTDEGKAIGIGLDRIGRVLEEAAKKSPLDKVEKLLAPPGVSTEAPPPAEVGAEAKPSLDELRREGLVVRVMDRLRGK